MRKLVLFMHVSLDGIAAKPGGGLEWALTSDEMFDYAKQQTEASDLALYGRGTYEIMQAYWPTAADKPKASKHDIEHSTWYNKVDKVVLSKSMRGQIIPKTTVISDNALAKVEELKQQDGKNIVMFGSPGAAHQFIRHDLVDDYWIFINPVILGKGTPLFDNTQPEINLKLVKGEVFPNGVVCMHYEREHPG
jgi:dihydrofolate reductase